MAQLLPTAVDIEIDKLTNSIENAVTGEIFDTEVTLLTNQEEKLIKTKNWQFNWKQEIKDPAKKVYKLTTLNNLTIIQGLLNISDMQDHVFMHLIENAKFNKGTQKMYKGVAGNLIAFACKVSFELGYEGVVAFVSKTQLVDHYQKTIGAKQFAGNRMFIDTREALTLVKKYFKNFSNGKS